MRLRFVIIGSLAVATAVLAVLGPQATAARDVKLPFACKLLKSALKQELPITSGRLRLVPDAADNELQCMFDDGKGPLGLNRRWMAAFRLSVPLASASQARSLWQRDYTRMKKLESEANGTDVTRLRGYGADNAFAVVVTDTKRDRNQVNAFWQKGVFVGDLAFEAPRKTAFATDTEEVEDLLPVLMRGVPRTYP